MATTTEINRVATILRAAVAIIAALPEVTQWWDDPAEWLSRDTFETEWEELLNRLSLVSALYERGELPHGERAAYERAMEMLAQQRDLADRLTLPIFAPAVVHKGD